jgi:hypothetical protein
MASHFNKCVTKYHHYIIHLVKEGHFATLSPSIQSLLYESCFSHLFNLPMNRSNIDP